MENGNEEKFSSRLGFIFLSAGCAIGLGNVWRFPYIAGMYGGALFILIYLVFLALIGIPVMSMEFSVGRASHKTIATSFDALEPEGTKWHTFGWLGIAGNYMLMMFYTTVTGWVLAYLFFMMRGDFANRSAGDVYAMFGKLISSAESCVFWMALVCAAGFAVCAVGLQNKVEKITGIMMTLLFVIMIVLAVSSVTLPGASEGLAFYLMPNLGAIREHGLFTVIYAALGQAVFTLSLGVGSMAIFGSFIGHDRRLLGESINITILDTFIAIMAGLIIFPACSAFGVDPGYGPGLVFIALPNLFNQMPMGYFWGILFFISIFFAAFSTVVAVFENIISFLMDKFGISRKKSALINLFAMIVLSIPCSLGYNVLSGFQPMGPGSTVFDLEDFIVANNLLPLGCVVYVLFCVSEKGWGWGNFMAEVNAGKGSNFPKKLKLYCKYAIPTIILTIFILGYIEIFTR